MDSKRSEAQPDELPIEAACEAFDDGAHEFAANQAVRKSTKAQRVKSYLKKCKDAALGTGSSQGAEELKAEGARTTSTTQDEEANANAKRTEHKAQKDVLPNTCWYVADNFETTSNVQDQVPVYEIKAPLAEESEIREELVNYDLGGPPVTFVTKCSNLVMILKLHKSNKTADC